MLQENIQKKKTKNQRLSLHVINEERARKKAMRFNIVDTISMSN